MIQKAVDEWLEGKLGEDLRKPYPERNEFVSQLREEMLEAFAEKLGEEDFINPEVDHYEDAFQMALHKDVRKGIVEDNLRPDGRKLDEMRPLSAAKSASCRGPTARACSPAVLPRP